MLLEDKKDVSLSKRGDDGVANCRWYLVILTDKTGEELSYKYAQLIRRV